MLSILESPYMFLAWIAISEKALLDDLSGCDAKNILKVGVICAYEMHQDLC